MHWRFSPRLPTISATICTRHWQAARMSAVPEICRRDCAEIPGAHQRIKSANFADLVSDLKRLGSAQGPLLSDESMQAECKAQEQKGS